MPRRVEDIVPAKHRSIRDIPSSRTNFEEPLRRPTTKKEQPIKSKNEITISRAKEAPRHMPITPPPLAKVKRKLRFKGLIITLIVFIAIATMGFFGSIYYSRATFNIIPKTVPILLNGTKTFVAKAEQSTNKDVSLTYNTIIVQGTASSTVPATNGVKTDTKATGKFTIYNEFSAQPVKLIAGTRIAGKNNLVYRLSSSISIPGYKKTASNIEAGKLTTSVVADQIGQEYNATKASMPEDLKIVAYKGTERYETIYARISSDLTGGFSGTKKIISTTIMASTTEALKSSLTNTLLSQAKSKMPADHIMYDTNYVITFGTPIVNDNDAKTATVSMKGTIYAITFPRDLFIETITGDQSEALFKNFKYTAPGLESLNITINNLKDFSPEKKTTLVLRAKGEMKLIGTIPVDEIKDKLSGISLGESENVFRSYGPIIESATGELLPPWSKVPTDLSRINIIVEKD